MPTSSRPLLSTSSTQQRTTRGTSTPSRLTENRNEEKQTLTSEVSFRRHASAYLQKLFKNQLRLELTYRATISMGTQKTGCRWDDELGGPTRWERYFREMVTFTWSRFRVCILHRLFRLLESNWHKILQFILHVQPKTLFSPPSGLGQANLWFPTGRGQGYLKFKTLLHANTIIYIWICQHQWMNLG